jgi:hypothetical protein
VWWHLGGLVKCGVGMFYCLRLLLFGVGKVVAYLLGGILVADISLWPVEGRG